MQSNFSRRIYWKPELKTQECLAAWFEAIDWQKVAGLLPAIVQDRLTKQVLMQGFMNREALEQSLQTGKVTFYSRTRKRLWCKGETSGNYLLIQELALDCDSDSLLVSAEPCGPTCHLGSKSCYSSPSQRDPALSIDEESLGVGCLGALQRIILERSSRDIQGEASYVQKLLSQGTQRIAQKIGEEGVEVALAVMALEIAYAKPQKADYKSDIAKLRTDLAGEVGDLLFHILVMLQACGMELQDAIDILEQRHRQALEKKNSPKDPL